LRQDALADQVLDQDVRLGPRVSPQEFFNDLIQLTAFDQIASPQLVYELLTRTQFGGHHDFGILYELDRLAPSPSRRRATGGPMPVPNAERQVPPGGGQTGRRVGITNNRLL
jgi:hypothetical protein